MIRRALAGCTPGAASYAASLYGKGNEAASPETASQIWGPKRPAPPKPSLRDALILEVNCVQARANQRRLTKSHLECCKLATAPKADRML